MKKDCMCERTRKRKNQRTTERKITERERERENYCGCDAPFIKSFEYLL